jgi:hypothetical protein
LEYSTSRSGGGIGLSLISGLGRQPAARFHLRKHAIDFILALQLCQFVAQIVREEFVNGDLSSGGMSVCVFGA